jgi:transposase
VTLGLVLDASGFPKRSEFFSGNVGEAGTLEQMITELQEKCLNPQEKPTIVMDAGIATEENITWMKGNGYKYIVVSRKRKREFCEQEAIVV